MAGNFAILSKAAITNIPSSFITGDIGASPISGSAIGPTCAEVTGHIYSVDAAGPLPCRLTNATRLTTAISNMETAYSDAAGRAPSGTGTTELGAGDIGGLTFAPGVYKWSTSVTIPTDIILSGGTNDIWIFQIAGDLDIASGKQIILSGGAKSANIFWQVGGPNGATLATTSVFNGTILSEKQIILRTGATLNGRALAQTQVVLDQNTLTIPSTPSVSGKMVRNITQTGAKITFDITDVNFSNGTGSVIVYTGGIVSNLVETGATSFVLSGGLRKGNSLFKEFSPSTQYEYLIRLTNNLGEITSDTGSFTTAGIPIPLTGGTSAQTGATSLTGASLPTGTTLDLSGTTLIISSNPFDSSFITGSLSITGTNILVTGPTSWNGILIPPTLIDSTTSEAATSDEI